MAEDDFFAIRAGKYRSSRYPGFTGGGVDSVTGNVVQSPTVSNPNGLSLGGGLESISAQKGAQQQASAIRDLYADIPTPKVPSMGDMVEPLAISGVQGAGTWAGGQIGAVAGKEVAAGAGVGDAIGKGASALGEKVSGWFGGGEAAVDVAKLPPTSYGEGMQGFAAGVSDPIAPMASEGLADGAGAATSAGTESFGDSLGGSLTDSANIGGSLGAGVARAGIGLLTGEKPATAIKSGVGTAAGTYAGTALGTAVGGPVGGAVGGFIGGAIGGAVGGRVICTELADRGMMDMDLLTADIEFSRRHISTTTLRGYHFWAVPFVHLMRRSQTATNLVEPFARWRAEELAYRMGQRRCGSLKGKLVRLIGEPLCFVVGLFVADTDWTQLYTKEDSHA